MPNRRRSASLKLVSGTARADRNPRRDPGKRLARCPGPPQTLSEGARREWLALAPIAHRLGTLSEADLRAFQLLVEVLCTERLARQAVDEHGLTILTMDGGQKANPALRAMETARNQATRLLGDFGLTPRGRGSIDPAPPVQAADPADRYF